MRETVAPPRGRDDAVSLKPVIVPHNAQMVNEQRNRVDDALTSLVKLHLPPDQDGDEEAANNRREDVHDVLRSLVKGNVFPA